MIKQNCLKKKTKDELRLEMFPRFAESDYLKLYIRCKSAEFRNMTVKDFKILKVLGRGAFGSVNACIKIDTGMLYAMKCINKKRVAATDSVAAIMSERDFLAAMESRFVTQLKYALMDNNTLYFVLCFFIFFFVLFSNII